MVFPADVHTLFQSRCTDGELCSAFSKQVTVVYGDYTYQSYETTTFFFLKRKYDDGSGGWDANGWLGLCILILSMITLIDPYVRKLEQTYRSL